MGIIDNACEIFAGIFREVAQCEFPRFVSPQAAGEFGQMHDVVVWRRMVHPNWTFDLPPNSDSKMRDCPRAALCSINNDYRRNLRHRGAPQANVDEEETLADPPVEDECVLGKPGWPVLRRPLLCPKDTESRHSG